MNNHITSIPQLPAPAHRSRHPSSDIRRMDAAARNDADPGIAAALGCDGSAYGRFTPTFDAKDLPGPLGIASLAKVGALVPLDSTGGYLTEQAHTVIGRAAIVQRMIPANAVACMALALWIWVGGQFPPSLAVIAHAHLRSTTYGRRLRVYDRRLDADERSRLGELWVTSPLRTACDLACELMSDNASEPDGSAAAAVVELMEDFDFTIDDCIAALARNTRRPGHARGQRVLASLHAANIVY